MPIFMIGSAPSDKKSSVILHCCPITLSAGIVRVLCTRQQNSTVVPKLFPLVIDIGDGILQMIQSESYETKGFASMFFDCNRFVLMGFYADE